MHTRTHALSAVVFLLKAPLRVPVRLAHIHAHAHNTRIHAHASFAVGFFLLLKAFLRVQVASHIHSESICKYSHTHT